MRSSNAPKRDYSHGPALEPRVAKLELGMERLTDDVRDLAQVVRSQGQNMEQEIQKLIVAVTQAAGPKKTDWGTIIAGLMLVLAIGGAAFWPLNQVSQENKIALTHLEQRYDNHQSLMLHPVGAALVDRLEGQLKTHIEINQREMSQHMADAKEMHTQLLNNFHNELALATKAYDFQLTSLQDKVDLHNDRLYNRVVKLEDYAHEQTERELEELSKWRQKAMGLYDNKVSVTKPQP